MVTKEEMEGIVLREKEKRLTMSSVPKDTKALFIELANESFGENYGPCLKWCLEQALEYQDMKGQFFENINMKLDLIQNTLLNPVQAQAPPKKYTEKRMLGGNVKRIMKKEVKTHE